MKKRLAGVTGAASTIEDPALVRAKKKQQIKIRAGYFGLHHDVLRDWVGHCNRRPRCKNHSGTIICADELMPDNGDKVGSGPTTLHCMGEGGNHFVPLMPMSG